MINLSEEMKTHGQIVLVLQGGGALGAYQAGVYQAMHETGIDPDWVIGTSIGAINASIIAGNMRDRCLERLREFWERVEQHDLFGPPDHWFGQLTRNMHTISMGLPAFFKPNVQAFMNPHTRLGPENAAYYSVEPLRETLSDLVDFEIVNAGETRLTVGASHVSSSEMRYFDSRDEELSLEHVMASGALPPSFPAVRVDGELYWDGGILSNTPVEAVFDDRPRRNSLVFTVHIWNPDGEEPETVWEVMNRQKDVQYSSRAESHIKRQRQLHRLRHVVAELAKRLPEDTADDNMIKELASYGCMTRTHVIRLLAPNLPGEDHLKDIDFSPKGIRQRWEAGYQHTMMTLEKAPWRGSFDPIEGIILHETCGGEVLKTPSI